MLVGLVEPPMGCGGRVVERRAFRSNGPRFKTWAISFTPLCPCLSEETLKADPMQGNGENLWWTNSREGHLQTFHVVVHIVMVVK